jgi:hypothetical protein
VILLFHTDFRVSAYRVRLHEKALLLPMPFERHVNEPSKKALLRVARVFHCMMYAASELSPGIGVTSFM